MAADSLIDPATEPLGELLPEPGLSDQLNTARLALRLLADLTRESIWPETLRSAQDIPRKASQITADWLTLVLCNHIPGARVTALTFQGGSKGTSERHQLSLTYNDAGTRAGLPTSIFVKLTPGFLTSFGHSISGSMAGETWFYRHIKPKLHGNCAIESPKGYFSAHDIRQSKSVHLIEDLTQTKAARFCDMHTAIDRPMAASMATNLATLHATFYKSPLLATEFRALHNFTDFFTRGHRAMNLRKYHLKGLQKAAAELPDSIRENSVQSWEAICKATSMHNGSAPMTLCHGDVHLANWYITGDQRMGLLDWQVVSQSHWSRDLAYWLSSCLSIDQRREWEVSLLETYRERFAAVAGVELPAETVAKAYRQQLLCALAFWTPTYAPPALLPDNMQPQDLALDMLRRICTAIDDHDSIELLLKDNWTPEF